MTSFELKCSFCGKSAADVAKLVAGRSAHICEACVADAARIMHLPGRPPVAPGCRLQLAWRAIADRVRNALWPAPDLMADIERALASV